MSQPESPTRSYRFGPFTLDLDRFRLNRDGDGIDLRPKAFDTLRMLVERSGQLVSKDELVAAVWPDVTVNDDSLAQCLRDVRKALGDDGQRYIRTVHRRGYMFVAEVEHASAVGGPAPTDSPGTGISESRVPRRLAAILAADVVGYSRLIGVDEVGTLDRLRALRAEPINRLVAEHRGRIVKEMGDGFLAEFASVVDAVQCATGIQASLTDGSASHDEVNEIAFRIGINLGDVIVEGDDLFGDGVNVAARLEGLAEPGGICISGSVYEQVRNRLRLGFEDMGPQALKNIAEPVAVYRIAAGPPRAPRTQRREARRWVRWAMPALAVVLAVVVAGGGAIWWQWPSGAPDGSAVPSPGAAGTRNDAPVVPDRRLTIAVLPFETSSETAQDKWLGDGIAEDITTELSRFREIGVIARNSSFRYGAQPVDVRALREDLGADFVLQGSTRLLGDQFRLALQLVDTQTGANSWAERYDRPFSDVLSIKADVVNQISARLFAEAQDAAGARIADRDPQSLDAFESVLRARWFYYRFTRDGTKDALALLERAVEIDPDYAAAWELLSRIMIQLYVQPYDERRGDPATLERAIAAARKAVALDPRHSTALATLGNAQIWAGEHAAGLQDLRRAIEFNPADAVAVGSYADALSRAGYQEEALAAWAESERLDPLVLPITKGLIARSHILLGDFETAHALTSQCLQRAPRILPCQLFHIMAASGLGRTEDVNAAVATVRELAPRFSVSGWLDIIKYGDANQARTLSTYLLDAGLSP